MEWLAVAAFAVVGLTFAYIAYDISTHANKTNTKHGV